jgi:hypothetical protein
MHINLNSETPIISNKTKSNKISYFIETDTKEMFYQNKKKMGIDWYYYNKPIEYKYNEWGYRCKNFNELKDDYMIVFGCSYTEGVGLYLEDTWSYKVAQNLNYDVLNLGMGGTGPIFSFYNTILLYNHILKTKKYPKLVVYQWSFKERTCYPYIDKDYNYIGLQSFSIAYPESSYPPNYKDYFDWYKVGFITNQGDLCLQTNISTINSNNIWRSLGIPVINWTWKGDFEIIHPEYFNNDIKINLIDDNTKIKARDLGHNGHMSQDIVMEFLLNELKRI